MKNRMWDPLLQGTRSTFIKKHLSWNYDMWCNHTNNKKWVGKYSELFACVYRNIPWTFATQFWICLHRPLSFYVCVLHMCDLIQPSERFKTHIITVYVYVITVYKAFIFYPCNTHLKFLEKECTISRKVLSRETSISECTCPKVYR